MRMKPLSICCFYHQKVGAESLALPLGDAPTRLLFYQIAIKLSSDFAWDNKKYFSSTKIPQTGRGVLDDAIRAKRSIATD